MMTLEKLTNIIEAILFAAGDAVPVDLLREKLDVSKKDVDEAIRQLEFANVKILGFVYNSAEGAKSNNYSRKYVK